MRRIFSPEFKQESAQLILDQNHTLLDGAVGISTMTGRVGQLREKRQSCSPKASPITPEQIEIREYKENCNALKYSMKF